MKEKGKIDYYYSLSLSVKSISLASKLEFFGRLMEISRKSDKNKNYLFINFNFYTLEESLIIKCILIQFGFAKYRFFLLLKKQF